MTKFTLSLAYARPTALLEATPGGVPRDIHLIIDWEQRTISAETRAPESRGTHSEYEWRGRQSAYSLPTLVDAAALRDWVIAEVVPRAAPLADAYELIYEDVDPYGRFPGHETKKGDFDHWMATEAAPPEHNGGLWDVCEWLADDLCGVRATTTDEQLRIIADEILLAADKENIVLVGGRSAVLEYLQDVRDEEEPPDPDLYQIRGYEVYERTARRQGNSAMVQIPAGDIGKRFKVVRIDP